ncbi:MAG: hypothetical protein AAB944_00555 [Patescibacteria group bacterium]
MSEKNEHEGVRFSPSFLKSLIGTLDSKDSKAKIVPLKITAACRRRKKELTKFLQEKEEAQKSPSPPMYFKESRAAIV